MEKGKGKEHLDKDFLEELKHKIWSTKGSRFKADQRLRTVSKYSNLCIHFLSAYLIIFGLISVYNLYNQAVVDPNVIAFAITAMSIMVLVFSLLENSEDYKLKAKNFHDCALALATLYNELQNFKTYRKEATDKEKMDFAEQMQKRYQTILERHENHHPIDNRSFKLQHSDYYSVEWTEKILVPVKYFCLTRLIYLVMIILPAVVLAVMLYKYSG